jgi:hypothetical protein
VAGEGVVADVDVTGGGGGAGAKAFLSAATSALLSLARRAGIEVVDDEGGEG